MPPLQIAERCATGGRRTRRPRGRPTVLPRSPRRRRRPSGRGRRSRRSGPRRSTRCRARSPRRGGRGCGSGPCRCPTARGRSRLAARRARLVDARAARAFGASRRRAAGAAQDSKSPCIMSSVTTLLAVARLADAERRAAERGVLVVGDARGGRGLDARPSPRGCRRACRPAGSRPARAGSARRRPGRRTSTSPLAGSALKVSPGTGGSGAAAGRTPPGARRRGRWPSCPSARRRGRGPPSGAPGAPAAGCGPVGVLVAGGGVDGASPAAPEAGGSGRPRGPGSGCATQVGDGVHAGRRSTRSRSSCAAPRCRAIVPWSP